MTAFVSKSLKVMSLLSSFAVAPSIFANTMQMCPTAPARIEHSETICIEQHDSRLQIGGSYSYVTIKPHDHRTFKGNLGGAQISYEFRPLNRFYGGGKFTVREGKTHGAQGIRTLEYYDVHERLGYTYAPESEDWFITLFSGFGYRHLEQKLKPKAGSTVRFNYNEFYIPVGILTNYDVLSWFSIGLNYIWMPQVFSSVTIVPLKGARWKTSNKMSNSYLEMPLTFDVTADKRFQITFSPFYERWHDGHTTAKLSTGTPLGLPGNTYNFYGAELNFGYCF
jgi:hypothetical protein